MVNRYPLCHETVTVYRMREGEISRQVVENCHLERRSSRRTDDIGSRERFPFLLIMPGAPQRVFPGDRVMAGVGPEIAPEQWEGFLPVTVPGLLEVASVAPYYWEGRLCHVEARA